MTELKVEGMTELEVEDFIMCNELNWNPAGFKKSTGIMRSPEVWRDWKKTRENPDYAVYIERTVVMNNKDKEFEKFKAKVQSGEVIHVPEDPVHARLTPENMELWQKFPQPEIRELICCKNVLETMPEHWKKTPEGKRRIQDIVSRFPPN
jgi:hypothetical protein